MGQEGVVRANTITTVVLGVLTTVIALPVRAAELAPSAGRGATLTVVGLVTLVLAAIVFALFHWIEAARTRQLEAGSESGDEKVGELTGNEGATLPSPKLAIVPVNPMLDALSRKQGGAQTAPGHAAMVELDPGEADGQLAAAQ
jgi:hypothetical protein